MAEEMIFGKENITSGASGDIQQATQPGPRHGHPLGLLRRARHSSCTATTRKRCSSGMSMGRQQNVSEATAQMIDAEVQAPGQHGYEDASRILTEKLDDLDTARQGAAGVRDPDRRRDQGPDGRASGRSRRSR